MKRNESVNECWQCRNCGHINPADVVACEVCFHMSMEDEQEFKSGETKAPRHTNEMAEPNQRFGGWFIDTVALALFCIPCIYFLDDASIPIIALVIPAYYLLMEWRWGKTLGKMIFHTKVVSKGDSRKASFAKLLVRTVFRLFWSIDIICFFFVGRTLHDILSFTDVATDN